MRPSPPDVDPHYARSGVVGEPERAVQYPGRRQVVHVRLVAECQLPSLVASGTRADPTRQVRLGHRLAETRPRDHLDGVDDLDVPGAPAQVPGERASDLLA